MNEADLLLKYCNTYYIQEISQVCKLLVDVTNCNIHVGLNASMLEVIDVPSVKEKMDELCTLLQVRKRYLKLNALFNDKLTFFGGCFQIDDHKFSNLDEVERVHRSKAFL